MQKSWLLLEMILQIYIVKIGVYKHVFYMNNINRSISWNWLYVENGIVST